MLGQVTTAKTNGQASNISKQANGQNELPQTNEKVTPVGATIGLGLLVILAAFGFKRKKRDDE
ncbi:LPXTG cell wall anchor domain-containing protein [Lactobacillus sp. LC28-10]|uniref:LPXTG cell wall anchor domain-containing protein n=1 Tax=Secundilactobacillus angelensis TaxID=2722706 RepID=A0ABX1KWC9_9LACO|nr:LPXTG cell wall anchor domain-containing protein [Secundilactobacillus angelensis]MCH5462572.1 LPXTG cell wall anchor domain-containing protein [Secundilactobacillus angelensis]NLR18237.1 LPXTG cell wall anchor domain-containing protein [Secundilactobacillus angelensis]